MNISAERLKELELAERKLDALESAGVDTWENYGLALEYLITSAMLESLTKKVDNNENI